MSLFMPREKKLREEPTEDEKIRYRRGQALSFGYTMIAGMLVFTGLGYWADKKFDTAPLWLIVGMFLGLIYSWYELWKLVRMYNDE